MKFSRHLSMLLCLFTTNVAWSFQQCQSDISRSTANSRFQLQNNNSEIKDLKTGLIWERCPLGQSWSGTACTGSIGQYTWANALQTAKNKGNGWRMPNIKELKSIVEDACFDPAVNLTFFLNVAEESVYWSSSPNVDDATSAWAVMFNDGKSSSWPKIDSISVRLVRN